MKLGAHLPPGPFDFSSWRGLPARIKNTKRDSPSSSFTVGLHLVLRLLLPFLLPVPVLEYCRPFVSFFAFYSHYHCQSTSLLQNFTISLRIIYGPEIIALILTQISFFGFCNLSSMEAFSSSSTFLLQFTETTNRHSLVTTPHISIKPLAINRIGCSKLSEIIDLSSSRISTSTRRRFGTCGSRIFSASTDVPGRGEENSNGSDNGVGKVSDEFVGVAEANSDQNQNPLKVFDDKPTVDMHLAVGYGAGGGTRAGLFRTPISGGVQSATSAHGLPRPALAVRNLMEQARFAHLCTVMSRMHHRRLGYPFGSLVDFAPDPVGHPIFSFSPLAIHTRNLLADPRCTLVVQIPGWSGLSNARVTIFGDVYPLPEHQQEWAHKQYIAKHQQGPSQQWGNFYYFRMQNISDIYFIGGFGTVAWVDVREYESIKPDKIAVEGGESYLKELNAIFSKPLKELLSIEIEVDDAALISIDSKGTDVRVRQGAQFNIQRVSFEEGHLVETLEQAKAALWKLINKGRVHNMQK